MIQRLKNWWNGTIKFRQSDVNSLNLATFNIQIFGKSKMSKPDVVKDLVQILTQYDIVVIQEIRDASQVSFPQLIEQLNGASIDEYQGLMGPRVGRTSSTEQYGFIYKTKIANVVSTYQYPDLLDDFERPPYVVTFQLNSGPTFGMINIHTKPSDAVNEISHLVDVYDAWEAQSTFGNDAIILGDFNADCNYVCKTCWDEIDLWTDDRFTWLVGNNADTTTGSTDCAYDRVVTAGDWIPNRTCCALPYDYEKALNISHEEALDVSDHYPVVFNM